MANISGETKVVGVLGWPVSHSLSPRMHNFWMQTHDVDGVYIPIPVRPDCISNVLGALPGLGFTGVNVTVPYKELALDFVDTIDDNVQRIGALNTIIYDKNGKAHGMNTDCAGFINNICQQDPEFHTISGPALIIGAGGAARAAIVALQDFGMTEIWIANRTPEKAHKIVTELGHSIRVLEWDKYPSCLKDISVLVNATSLGMEGQPNLVIDLSQLPLTTRVHDIVYAPLETNLIASARRRGNTIIDGIGMLLHQGSQAFEAWFGFRPAVTNEIRQYVLGGH